MYFSTTNQIVLKDTWYKIVLFPFLRCSETALNFQKWFFCVSNAEGSISILLTFILNLFFVLSLKALEKAKEAGRKERALCRQREQTSLGDQINLDLTYSVSRL